MSRRGSTEIEIDPVAFLIVGKPIAVGVRRAAGGDCSAVDLGPRLSQG